MAFLRPVTRIAARQEAFEGHDQAPSEAVKSVASGLEQELGVDVAKYQTLVSQDVAGYNKLAAADGAPILVAPIVRPQG